MNPDVVLFCHCICALVCISVCTCMLNAKQRDAGDGVLVREPLYGSKLGQKTKVCHRHEDRIACREPRELMRAVIS
jgi:hypothetical protein